MASGSCSSTPISSQKKRALEALEQRFAAAKASKLLQEKQLKFKSNSQNTGKKPCFGQPRKDAATSLASRPTSSQHPFEKGNATISSSTPRRKASGSSDGEGHPVYSEISVTIHDNLLQAGTLDSARKGAVHGVVYDIIRKGDEGGKFARGAKSLKLDSWVLLDNFVPKSPGLAVSQAKALTSHSKRSQKHMSMKQHRKYGSFDLPEEFRSFDLYKPMHEMWKEYIRELIKDSGKKQLSQHLLTADLHGALILVVECKVATFQGVSGIMIRETAETFGIISENNCFQVVPKAGSVFILQADCWKITLCGDKLSPKEKLKESKARQHLRPLLTK